MTDDTETKKIETAIALYEEVLEKCNNEIKRLEAELEKELEGKKVAEVEREIQEDGQSFILAGVVKFACSKKDLLEMQLKATVKQKEVVELKMAYFEYSLHTRSVMALMQKAADILGEPQKDAMCEGLSEILADILQAEDRSE